MWLLYRLFAPVLSRAVDVISHYGSSKENRVSSVSPSEREQTTRGGSKPARTPTSSEQYPPRAEFFALPAIPARSPFRPNAERQRIHARG